MSDYQSEFEKWKSPTTTTTTKPFLGLQYFVTRSQKYSKTTKMFFQYSLITFEVSSQLPTFFAQCFIFNVNI